MNWWLYLPWLWSSQNFASTSWAWLEVWCSCIMVDKVWLSAKVDNVQLNAPRKPLSAHAMLKISKLGKVARHMKKSLIRRMEPLSDPSEVSGAWDLRSKMAILQWISDWKDIQFGRKFKSQICQVSKLPILHCWCHFYKSWLLVLFRAQL